MNLIDHPILHLNHSIHLLCLLEFFFYFSHCLHFHFHLHHHLDLLLGFWMSLSSLVELREAVICYPFIMEIVGIRSSVVSNSDSLLVINCQMDIFESIEYSTVLMSSLLTFWDILSFSFMVQLIKFIFSIQFPTCSLLQIMLEISSYFIWIAECYILSSVMIIHLKYFHYSIRSYLYL